MTVNVAAIEAEAFRAATWGRAPDSPDPARWSEASLTGDLEKKAKLVLAEEKDQKKGRGLSLGPWVRSEPQEAALKEMVMVIGDTYMSKRSLPENNPFFGGSGRARVRFRLRCW